MRRAVYLVAVSDQYRPSSLSHTETWVAQLTGCNNGRTFYLGRCVLSTITLAYFCGQQNPLDTMLTSEEPLRDGRLGCESLQYYQEWNDCSCEK